MTNIFIQCGVTIFLVLPEFRIVKLHFLTMEALQIETEQCKCIPESRPFQVHQNMTWYSWHRFRVSITADSDAHIGLPIFIYQRSVIATLTEANI